MRSTLQNAYRRRLQFEPLESRWVLSASLGSTDQLVTPNLDVITPLAASSTPFGLSPAKVKSAYGFNGVNFNGVVGNGAGQTIAIVDAYNDPNIASDLATFDRTFGLSAPPSLKIVNQSGGSSLPRNDSGWAGEIALDVEWAHAIAPAANILLVEASSATSTALDAALDYARNATGVTVVSNSWGGSEYSGEKSEDVHFTTPAGHAGVTFTVAAGDNGAGAEYPSSSPDVLSVGGTSLRLTSAGSWSTESVWSGGGGGTSRYEGTPTYQSAVGVTNRGAPDVAYDANPYTGFAVYDTYEGNGWAEYGGTSAGAPQWAALIAIADQGRALAGKGSLANAQDALYSISRTDFHDITSGSNGYAAKAGYDLASGLGSPVANLVIRDLVAYNGSTSFNVAAATGSVTRARFFFFTGNGFSGFGQFDQNVAGAATPSSDLPSIATLSSFTHRQQFETSTMLGTITNQPNLTNTSQAGIVLWSEDDPSSSGNGNSSANHESESVSDTGISGGHVSGAIVDAAFAGFGDYPISNMV